MYPQPFLMIGPKLFCALALGSFLSSLTPYQRKEDGCYFEDMPGAAVAVVESVAQTPNPDLVFLLTKDRVKPENQKILFDEGSSLSSSSRPS